MQKTQVVVLHEVGLHARPASLFVSTAGKYQSNIKVRNQTAQGDWGNAKSILKVLTLGVEKGHCIEITAEGPDEEEAIKALEALVRSNFEGKA